jgi:hypothetical protein
MDEIPVPLRPSLRRLARRLVLGLFLDRWSSWAVVSLLLAGLVALACRMFVPIAASYLHWLWLAPVITAVPALTISCLRAFRPGDIVAIADWLNGGHGMLLALFDTADPAWMESPAIPRDLVLPRLRPWRTLRALPAALAFLGAALWLPQRAAHPSTTILADDIAGRLTAAVVELKQQDLITPEEEKTLEEEIERIRRGAEARMDASSWEAADALREKLAADVAAKRDALRWAEESLARYAAAAQGAGGAEGSKAAAAELAAALEKLAQSGLLAGAAADLQRQLKGARLAGDPKALRELAAAVSKYLGEANGRLGNVAALGKAAGRFDPAEFPLNHSAMSPDGDGDPGRGGVNRGRADAELTWGKETALFDRFKAKPLPPGAARGADDRAPIVELPGTPQASPEPSAATPGRQYGAAAGQAAWRRTLAPRHQSAVKKYFAK